MSWGCAYFFCILAANYALRPLRDEMGVIGGTDEIPRLFMFTLAGTVVLTPLFSMLVSRLSRRRFIPLLYRFFQVTLLGFFLMIWTQPKEQLVHVAQVFFVWASVLNIFAVSVFWSFMADLFSSEQGKRLFGLIGFGGTIGALFGSSIATLLARQVEPVFLLIAVILLLEAAIRSVHRLAGVFGLRTQAPQSETYAVAALADLEPTHREARPVELVYASTPEKASPSAEVPLRTDNALTALLRTFASPYLSGIVVCMIAYTISSSFLYLDQSRIVGAQIADSGQRTVYFARIDLYVNAISLVVQALLTARIIAALGVGWSHALLPIVTIAGFAGLWWSPSVALLLWVQVLRKAGDYAVAKPAREVLFTVIRREEKYKSKSWIDTFMYRAGDALGGGAYWLFQDARIGTSSVLVIPLSAIWWIAAILLGRRQRQLAAAHQNPD